MPRLLITWSEPRHVDPEQWARRELAALVDLPEVASISLARVLAPSRRHARSCEWLCELHLHEGADAATCVDRPQCADWIRDLGLLGLHPRVALVADGEAVT